MGTDSPPVLPARILMRRRLGLVNCNDNFTGAIPVSLKSILSNLSKTRPAKEQLVKSQDESSSVVFIETPNGFNDNSHWTAAVISSTRSVDQTPLNRFSSMII